jgi:hypothetical protein
MLKMKFSITPSKHSNLKMKIILIESFELLFFLTTESFELLKISNSLKFLITPSKHTLKEIKYQNTLFESEII